jgi:hypothetical protein
MKERPIVMQGHSIQSILAGIKTQTRRVIKPQRPAVVGYKPAISGEHWIETLPVSGDFGRGHIETTISGDSIKVPYGKIGDRLWVRETWCLNHPEIDPQPPKDGRPEHDKRTCWYFATEPSVEGEDNKSPWRSPLLMPRWASRLTLEITKIRVERLHDISAEDMLAEGVSAQRGPTPPSDGLRVGCSLGMVGVTALKANWREGWDKINGKRAPWSSNPWLWVIDFKKVEGSANP